VCQQRSADSAKLGQNDHELTNEDLLAFAIARAAGLVCRSRWPVTGNHKDEFMGTAVTGPTISVNRVFRFPFDQVERPNLKFEW
jgi:hypothetical protein